MNRISKAVLDCAFEIHTDLGRGMLESVYKAILAQLLIDLGFSVEREKAIRIRYKGRRYPGAYRADLAVNEALLSRSNATPCSWLWTASSCSRICGYPDGA